MFQPTIILLTAIHRRHEVAERMLRHHADVAARLQDVCRLKLAAVCSPEDAGFLGPLAKELDVFWRDQANRPLSTKWQRGLGFAADAIDCDAVMILGSDDFANEAFFRLAVDRLEKGSDGFGPDSIWFYQQSSGALGRWQGPMTVEAGDSFPVPAGAGRVFSRKLLDAVRWRLWEFSCNASLDTYCSKLLNKTGRRLEILPMADHPEAAIVDVKDGHNLHPWTRFDFAEVLPADAAAAQLEKLKLQSLIPTL